jgi:hypothetical protein
MRVVIHRSSTAVLGLAMTIKADASAASSTYSITATTSYSSFLQRTLRWTPTYSEAIIESEKRLLDLVK